VEQGATGNDSCDIWGPNYPIQIAGSVDFRAPGTYPITYTLADQAGHVTQRTRLVTVLPQGSCTEQLAAPVLALQYEARDPGGRRSNLQKRVVDVVNCPW
jgi:hypothetical protein